MKLYYRPRTRAARPRWLLEELGVPYELVRLNAKKGETQTPEYLKIHPHGGVPALDDGGHVLMESGAICMYLADKYSEKGLAPPIGTPERGLYYQWMFYTMATLEPPLIDITMHARFLPEDKRDPKVLEAAREKAKVVSRILTGALSGKEFIVGDHFTAADVLLGAALSWGHFFGLSEGFPEIQSYVARMTARPAFQRANAD